MLPLKNELTNLAPNIERYGIKSVLLVFFGIVFGITISAAHAPACCSTSLIYHLLY